MIKKLLAILTCIALIFVFFTACGDKNEDETPAGSNNVAQSQGVGEGQAQGNNGNSSAVTEAYNDAGDPYAEDLDNWE